MGVGHADLCNHPKWLGATKMVIALTWNGIGPYSIVISRSIRCVSCNRPHKTTVWSAVSITVQTVTLTL